jgi:putative sterol carrier protein
MGQATTDFFEELSERGHEPTLETTTGTLRFDVLKGGKQSERWLVTIDKGDIEVSHRNANADCIIQAPESLLDGMAGGEVNPLASLLRGAVVAEGDSRLMVRFQGLFPGPPRGAAPAARKARRGRKR